MLGIIVGELGRQTETYIANHIAGISPGQTTVCALLPCAKETWQPDTPVRRLYQSEHVTVQALRHALRVVAPHRLEAFDLFRLRRWLRSSNVDVAFCEYLHIASAVADACRRLSIPIIAHAHGYDVASASHHPGRRALYQRTLPLMDAIIVVSESMKERVCAFGVSAERVHVVPCGAVVRSTPRVHIDSTPHTIVAVGRLIAKKGPIFLLEAFRQVLHSGIDARLIVVGDGPFREPMEQFLRATGLDQRTQLVGDIEHEAVRDHLRAADVFVQHSVTAANGDEEGLPVSIVEAMAEGVPVVSTIHAGIPEVVQDAKTGFLVMPGDVAGMARRIVQLLNDSALRSAMGLAGRRRISERFSLEKQLRELRQIVDRRRRASSRPGAPRAPLRDTSSPHRRTQPV